MDSVSHLAAVDPREFERALRKFRGEKATAEILVRLVELLAGSALGRRERDRRLRIAMDVLGAQLDEDLIDAVASSLVSRGTTLPQPLQARMRRPATTQAVRPAAAAVVLAGDGEGVTVQLPRTPATARQPTRGGPVLLLGTESEQAANRALLESHSLTTNRIERVDLFLDHLSEPVSGIAVGSGWWRQFAPNEHADELRRICGASTIPWIRLDVTGLSPDVEAGLETIVRTVCGGDRPSTLLCHGRGIDITKADLSTIRRVCDVLGHSEGLSFHPEQLTRDEARLLRTVVIGHLRETVGALPEIDMLSVRFLRGSYSGAKVAIVSPDDGGVPLVAKFGKLSDLRDELGRGRGAQRLAAGSSPSLHFHAGAAVLVFEMVEGPRGGPAPQLAESLDDLIFGEIGQAIETEARVRNLKECLASAFSKLSRINERVASAPRPNCALMRTTADLIMRGDVQLSMHDPVTDAPINIVAALGAAFERLAKLDGQGTIHGDVHLGNFLVLGTASVLVDFATFGAGHPAYDIVRLDTQVWFRTFRVTTTERELALLIKSAVVDGMSFEALTQAYENALRFGGNRLCIHSMTEARRAGLRVLDRYGGDIGDLVSMYLATAAQAIVIQPAASALARAFVSGLASFLT